MSRSVDTAESRNYIRKILQKSASFYGPKHLNVLQGKYAGKACFTQDYKMFGFLDSWDIALKYLNALRPHEQVFNELILENAFVKPFFDVEWFTKDFPDYQPETVLNQIITCLKQIFSQHFQITLTQDDFYVKSCHRETDKGKKYSFHIIVSPARSIVCKDNTYCKFIARLLQQCVTFDDSLIDKSVYSKNRNLRLLGHCKSSSPDFPFLEHERRTDIRHYCVTFITKVYDLLKIPEQQIDMPRSAIDDVEGCEFPCAKEISDDIIEKVLTIVKTICPSVYFDNRVVNNFIDLNYDHGQKCPITGNVHDHIGLWAIIQNEKQVKDNLKIGCRSEQCKNYDNKCETMTLGSIHQLLESDLTTVCDIEQIQPVTFKENIIDKLGFELLKNEINQKVLGMSNIFKHIYGNRIKWVEENTTYYWNGELWQEDASLFIYRLISVKFPQLLEHFMENYHNLDEALAKETKDLIIKLRNAMINKSIINMVRALIYDRYFTKIKDICPCELSVKNGMVSLKTGVARATLPKDHITKSLDLEYLPDVYGQHHKNYKIFDTFVRDITRDIQGQLNDEMYLYMKWILGYALQGVPKHKKFFIFWGPEGFNGKSILLNTISSVLEYYAVTMDKSVVFQGPKKTAGSHSTELVRLENCRIGILADTSEDSSIDDSQVKTLTSITDKISVREIYGKQKEFRPTFVPIIATNFKIRVNLKDQAMYDRLILFPFLCRFVDEPDPEKPNERKANQDLANEFDDAEFKKSILCWLIDAALFYSQNENMMVPQTIVLAKQDYRKQMDIYQEFLGTCCNLDNTATKRRFITRKSELIEQFVNYCIEQGVRVVKGKCEKEFNKILESERVDGISSYIGVALKSDE